MIVNAIERGKTVAVMNETGRQILSLSTGFESKDGLLGFTSKTVSIRRGKAVFVYDESGRIINTTYVN